MKKVVVVVDMQNDFIDGVLGTEEAREVLSRLAKKLEREDSDLIFTMDTHTKEYLETQEGRNLPIPHCLKPEKGWELAAPLQIFAKGAKAILEKPGFGSPLLPNVVADYDEIEFVGLCTDICVIANAMLLKAFLPEKKIAVDANCCAGVTKERHENALAAMAACQIEIRR